MWYYEWNNQPFGPVSKETVAEALKTGKIDASTRVWQEGMTVWKRLDETQLAVLVGKTPPVEAAPVSPAPSLVAAAVSPLPAASVAQAAQASPVAKVNRDGLKKLFTWWFIFISVSLPFAVLLQVFPNETWSVGLTCLYEIPFLGGMVLQYILLYKFWKVIQPGGHARTTPGQAVGFLFIPFFNLYWYFVAFFGLAKDLNARAERIISTTPGAQVRKTHPLVALAFILIYFGQMALAVYLYTQTMSIAFSALGDPSQLTDLTTPFNLPLIMLNVIHVAFLLFIFWEFHRTSQDILAAEDKS